MTSGMQPTSFKKKVGSGIQRSINRQELQGYVRPYQVQKWQVLELTISQILLHNFGGVMGTPSVGTVAGLRLIASGLKNTGGKSLVRRASEGVLLSSPLVIKQLQDLSWPSPNEGG